MTPIVEIAEQRDNGFIVPKATVGEGKMIRFWVQILPTTTNNEDGYFAVERFKNQIADRSNDAIIKTRAHVSIAKNKISIKWHKFRFNVTAFEYLCKDLKVDESRAANLLDRFDINQNYQISNLGFSHQKVFSIICEFQQNQNVIFDYYGFSPHTENQLTEYVKSELLRGKSAISFDNLMYKNDVDLTGDNLINNLVIWRHDKVGVVPKRLNNFKLKKGN